MEEGKTTEKGIEAHFPKKRDLEERLINFAVATLEVIDSLPNTRACGYLSCQLERSCTSPALNYGEAQFAESRKAFIYKLKVCLKELKESKICLTILARRRYLKDDQKLVVVTAECVELVSIFTSAARTAIENSRIQSNNEKVKSKI
jgi:four helix bundle protein